MPFFPKPRRRPAPADTDISTTDAAPRPFRPRPATGRNLPTVPASSARNITNFFPGTTVPAVKTVPVTGAVLPGPSRAPDAPRTAAMPAPAPGPATRRSRTRGWTASPASCP